MHSDWPNTYSLPISYPNRGTIPGMARGQKVGWRLAASVPKTLPTKPQRIATGVWLRPSGRFFAYAYHEGKDRFVGSFETVHEAVEAREAELKKIADGQSSLPRADIALTLGEFVETKYYPEKLSGQKASTQRSTRARFNQHVAPVFGSMPLRKITYDHCSAFVAAMRAKTCSGQTRRESVRLLRTILADAVKRRLLSVNPADRDHIDLPPKESNTITVPTFEDAMKVIAAIANPVARMIASTLLQSGMRLNECLAVQWSSVSIEQRTIQVKHSIDQVTGKVEKPKTKAAVRKVDIPLTLATELAAYRARQEAGEIDRADPWMFPSALARKEGFPPVMEDRVFLHHHFLPAVAAVGCERFTPHALRHLWASLMIVCAPLNYVSKALGHTSVAFTLKQYTHLLPEDAEKGRGYLDGVFGAPVDGKGVEGAGSSSTTSVAE